MIAIIAEASKRNETFGGLGLTLATVAVARGSSVALLAPISSDASGSAILEYLINHFVMFDPDLAQSPLPMDEATDSLTKVGLLQALAANSDVRLAYVGGRLLCGKAGSGVLEALGTYRPKPVVMVEPKGESSDAMLLRKVLSGMDIVKLTQNEFSLLCPNGSLADLGSEIGVRNLWVREKAQQKWWSNEGWSISFPVSKCPEKEGAIVASFLHDRGCFGHDGENPSYHVTQNDVLCAWEATLEA